MKSAPTAPKARTAPDYTVKDELRTTENLSKYSDIWAATGDARHLWRALLSDGREMLDRYRIVRTVCGLTLVQAKEVYITTETEKTLAEHEEQVFRDLDELQRQAET